MAFLFVNFNSHSWNVISSTGPVIAPMSTPLKALSLPSGSFSVGEGTWIETDTTEQGCGVLLNENGVLILLFSSIN